MLLANTCRSASTTKVPHVQFKTGKDIFCTEKCKVTFGVKYTKSSRDTNIEYDIRHSL